MNNNLKMENKTEIVAKNNDGIEVKNYLLEKILIKTIIIITKILK